MQFTASRGAILGLFLLGTAFADLYDKTKHLYKDIGCTPTGSGDQLHYNCDHLQTRDETKCYAWGEEFVLNPETNKIFYPCTMNCTCLPPGSMRGDDTKPGMIKITTIATLQCGIICPPGVSDPDAFNKTGDSRWSLSGIQVDSSPTTTPQAENQDGRNDTNDTFICHYNGETYPEGQTFSPNDKDCIDCTCQRGFNGTITEPYCEPETGYYEIYNAQVIKDGCTFVFEQNGRSCDSNEFKCPEESDRVIPAQNPVANGGTCKWGNMTLNRGDTLAPPAAQPSLKCGCNIPPMVTCEKPGARQHD